MSLEVCPQHNQIKNIICAKNQCNILICQDCFKIHGETFHHGIGVRLNKQSKQFFIKWTDAVHKKLCHFTDVVSNMGYSTIFQIQLDVNHPKGIVNQLNFKQIQKIMIQILKEHQKITNGNLKFVKETKYLTQLIHPQFLKDLYNLVTADTKFNLQNIPGSIYKKLIDTFPQKQIYKFVNYSIIPKQLTQLQQQRKILIKENQQTISFKVPGISFSPNKKKSNTNINLPNSFKTTQSLNGHINEIVRIQPNVNLIQSPSNNQQHKVVITSNKLLQGGQINHTFQKLQTTIALLKSNQQMYLNKISKLQSQNLNLKKKIQQIQSKTQNQKSQQKVLQMFNDQQNNKLRQQILLLEKAQQRLINQNKVINVSLKDIQDLAQNRSRTIISLQTQIQKIQQNLLFKQKSIKQLNSLISNEQQQITYRQNQVEILQEQIKKLLNRIKQLQNSIKSLNQLIANEEQQIAYRENQSQILTKEVHKLLNQIQFLNKSIHMLNNLISNQEEEITYRQNQAQTLMYQVKKLLLKNKQLQKYIEQNKAQLNIKDEQINKLKHQIQNNIHISNQTNNQQIINEQLTQQVVLLEADLKNKQLDLQILMQSVQQYILSIQNENKKKQIFNKLKQLRTIKVNF